jgi:hypothetical protein
VFPDRADGTEAKEELDGFVEELVAILKESERSGTGEGCAAHDAGEKTR